MTIKRIHLRQNKKLQYNKTRMHSPYIYAKIKELIRVRLSRHLHTHLPYNKYDKSSLFTTESTNHNSLLRSPSFNPLFCISCHIPTKGARYVLPRLHWSLKSNTMLLLIPLLTRGITTNMHDSNQYATTPPN